MRRLVCCPCVTGATLCAHLRGEYQTAGGIERRGMGLRARLLVSSRARLTPGDCVLTVDDITRSSAILCFTFCKIALPLRRALPDNEVYSGARTAPLALCPSQTAVVVPLPASPASVRRTLTTRLTVLLELSTGLSCIRLIHLAHERSPQGCSLQTIATRRQIPAVVLAIENVVHPHLSSV